MQYQIKELGLGGILDQSIKLLKNHFVLLMGIVAVVYLPFNLLQGFAALAILPELPVNPTIEDFETYQEAVGRASLYLAPLGLISVLVIYPITNGAVIYAVSRCYLNEEVTIGDAYSHANKILLSLLGTWILMTLAIMGGFILLIIPGIIFSIWFCLSSHTVVIERESGQAALSRSKKLVKGSMGTVIALGFVLGVIQWGISGGAHLVPQKHVAMLAQVILGSVAFLFYTVAFVVFYFSCRCKVENFDLNLLAENVGAEEADQPELGM